MRRTASRVTRTMPHSGTAQAATRRPAAPPPERAGGALADAPGGHRMVAPAAQAATVPAWPWNCSSSVEPFMAVVELWPRWMVWVTASK